MRHGPERLSNSELLAILLGSGTKSLSAAQNICGEVRCLAGLLVPAMKS